MSRITPQIRNLAARLIAFEASGNKLPGPLPPPAVQVCEKLRPHLATLMGKSGFRAILKRALAVVSAGAPWLVAVQVKADGTLEGWDKAEAQVDPDKLTESGVLLVAQLIGLLVAFIGASLTLRVLGDVWPALPAEDLNFTKEDHA